ncbi:Uncharacterised protein [Vibrio cholerae]|nr:Uncharacterised protein [Vibrio cholerae]
MQMECPLGWCKVLEGELNGHILSLLINMPKHQVSVGE